MAVYLLFVAWLLFQKDRKTALNMTLLGVICSAATAVAWQVSE